MDSGGTLTGPHELVVPDPLEVAFRDELLKHARGMQMKNCCFGIWRIAALQLQA